MESPRDICARRKPRPEQRRCDADRCDRSDAWGPFSATLPAGPSTIPAAERVGRRADELRAAQCGQRRVPKVNSSRQRGEQPEKPKPGDSEWWIRAPRRDTSPMGELARWAAPFDSANGLLAGVLCHPPDRTGGSSAGTLPPGQTSARRLPIAMSIEGALDEVAWASRAANPSRSEPVAGADRRLTRGAAQAGMWSVWRIAFVCRIVAGGEPTKGAGPRTAPRASRFSAAATCCGRSGTGRSARSCRPPGSRRSVRTCCAARGSWCTPRPRASRRCRRAAG